MPIPAEILAVKRPKNTCGLCLRKKQRQIRSESSYWL